MKVLVRFDLDCGRMGSLYGLFIATQEQVDALKGKEVYFDEALGKHSEIYAEIDDSNIKVLTDDQDFIEKLIQYSGREETISGLNPIHHYEESNGALV